MKLQPIHDNLLVQLAPRMEQSPGGIAIPTPSQKPEQWGTVVACGNKCATITQGDVVYVSPHHGTLYVEGGIDYVIIAEPKILAKQEDEK